MKPLLEQTPDAPVAQRARLEDIFASEGFEGARKHSGTGVDELVAKINAWFLRLFESTGAEQYSNVTRIVVLVAAFVVAVVLLARFIRHTKRVLPVPNAVSSVPEVGQPLDHLARATELLPSQPREAFRQSLLALLSWLEQQGLARLDRVKTNQEVVGELPRRGASAALTQSVAALIQTYDEAYYSISVIDSSQAASFLDAVRPLVARARQ